jgi:hypothetical protein
MDDVPTTLIPRRVYSYNAEGVPALAGSGIVARPDTDTVPDTDTDSNLRPPNAMNNSPFRRPPLGIVARPDPDTVPDTDSSPPYAYAHTGMTC